MDSRPGVIRILNTRPRNIEIAVIGDSDLVEKLLSCYMGNHFKKQEFGRQRVSEVKSLQLDNKLITIEIHPSSMLNKLNNSSLRYDYINNEVVKGSNSIIFVYDRSNQQSFEILKSIVKEGVHLTAKECILLEINVDNYSFPAPGLTYTATNFALSYGMKFLEIDLEESIVNSIFEYLVKSIWKTQSPQKEVKFDKSNISKKSFNVTDFILRLVEKEFNAETLQTIILENFFIKESVLEFLKKNSSPLLDMILELNLKTNGLEQFFAINRPLGGHLMHFFNRPEGNTTKQFYNFIEGWKKGLPALTKQYCAEYKDNSIAQQIQNLSPYLPSLPQETFQEFFNPRTEKYMEMPVSLKGEEKKVEYYDLGELKGGVHPVTKKLINLRDIQPGRILMERFDQIMKDDVTPLVKVFQGFHRRSTALKDGITIVPEQKPQKEEPKQELVRRKP